MQNPSDGMLEMLNKEEMDRLDEVNKKGEKFTKMTFRDGTPVPPDVARFKVGEIVDVNGGRFRVRKITKKDIILRGVPNK